MGSKRILNKEQLEYLHSLYHDFLSEYKKNKIKPTLPLFYSFLRTKNKDFLDFTDKQLSNQIIACRRLYGEDEWPNISNWDEYLPPIAISLIQKANNSCLLALEVFNKPLAKYRSEGFIIFMMIAWTSIFHALFLKNGEKTKYNENDDGYFDLRKCINKYQGIRKNEISKNLEVLCAIRDRIVHRDNPLIDERIFGYCQACVLNFLAVSKEYFGDRIQIHNGLAYSLQLSEKYDDYQLEAIKSYRTKSYYEVSEFLKTFEDELYNTEPEIFNSQYYAFRVYMIPKPVKENQSEAAIEMINYDYNNPSVRDEVNKVIFAIKETRVGGNFFKAGEVSAKIFEAIKDKMPEGWKFTASAHHARCAKHYKIREGYKTDSPEKTKKEFCIYDPIFGQYIYTQQWINFLIKKLKQPKEYDKIFSR